MGAVTGIVNESEGKPNYANKNVFAMQATTAVG